MGNPWKLTKSVYTYPDSSAAQWCRANPSDPRTPAIQASIASVPQALWLGPGAPKSWIASYVQAAALKQSLPQVVLYAIPDRDLGGFSAGGVATASAYRAFVDVVVSAIGSKPCVVIVEPDSLFMATTQSVDFQLQRAEMTQYVVAQVAQHCPNTWAYLDAGDAFDVPASTLAPVLVEAGIEISAGFFLNASNFQSSAVCASYAAELNALLGAYGIEPKPYVVDTSRNGAGRPDDAYVQANPDNWWSNPAGMKLGAVPNLSGRLWIKHPGESDGLAGIVSDVDSGAFDPRLAMALINGSVAA